MNPAGSSATEKQQFMADMDRLSLEQALIDFEVANKRVIDLTNRLVGALEENRVLRRELEIMPVRHYVASRLRRFGPLRGLVNLARGGRSRQ